MKIRSGFVSNSSSSSFVVAMRMKKEENFYTAFQRIFKSEFKLPKKYPFQIDMKRLAEKFEQNLYSESGGEEQKWILEGFDDTITTSDKLFFSDKNVVVRVGSFSDINEVGPFVCSGTVIRNKEGILLIEESY